ncbi:heterokaryon incompatibility protein-domain-containing protein [Pyrenochaeta sp. MPI-SDFR-AT-0127]|nr:heterokaryon incompatibility protein-domain-containing protein [Pyrenochaeta sp. MPI-SDFR-AT-0127]
MPNNDEYATSANLGISTLPEHGQQSRSSIALGKRPIGDRFNHNVETTPKPATASSPSNESAQTIDMMQSLRYLPLCLPKIRLISISPSMQDGKLKLTLSEAPLTDQLEFHALSYVWGESIGKKTIIVNDQLLDITENLYDFLDTTRKHEPSFLSHHKYPDYLKSYTSETAQPSDKPSGSDPVDSVTTPVHWWIDAICINQDDENEKSEQVIRMGDIYSMASRVWIWTGLPSKIFKTDPEFSDLRRALAFYTQDSIRVFDTQEPGEKVLKSLFGQFVDYQRQLVVERSVARMQAMGISIEPGPMMEMVYKRYAQLADQVSPQVTYGVFNNFLRQLADLLEQPYFERTWIIQEYILNPRQPIALLGNFVFDLDHITHMGVRLSHERQFMNDYVKVHVYGVLSRLGNLISITLARERWHNRPLEGFRMSVDSSELRYSINQPEAAFSHLPPGEKLDYLLHAFFTRQCSNDLDYFYGILGFFNHGELPESLLPDYSLPVGRVARDYTRYIVESTGELKIIESSMGYQLADCPSWVPNVKYLTARHGHKSKVSKGNKPFVFSDDGQCLTVEGTLVGEILSCSCAACPTEFTDKHLEFVQEVLLEGAAEITGKPVAEVFMTWLKDQVDVQGMLPSYLADITSMHDLLQRYHDVCSDIPPDVLTALNKMSIPQMRNLFDTPCRDPEFLYAFLRLAKMRYCLLSTGDIMLCVLKNTDNTATSPSHRWDDCAWALKGLHQLAILRPKDDAYEYCGPVSSGRIMLQTQMGSKEKYEFDLNDDFFAEREMQQVTLV